MVRRLLCALALTLLAVPAFAQSDTRKLAVFVFQGDEAQNYLRTTGTVNATAKPYNETHTEAMWALERMGVPVEFFEIADSANWWKKLGEAGPLAANNPGVPDSVRFRQAGFFGCLIVGGNTSAALPFIRYFQSGTRRGSYYDSPLSGRWGIPTVVFTDGMENNAGAAFFNGGAYISVGVTSPTGVSYIRHGFKKTASDFGDTLDVGRSLKWQIATGQIDSIDVLIRSDSLSLTGSAGGRMSAWKWKASTYYYPTGAAGTSIWTLLGLNTLFEAAGYTPRRKLNLHWTLDHPYPETITDTAPSESVWTYIDRNGWRWSAALKADGIARTNQTAAMANYWRAKMNAAGIGGYPHSHTTGIGNYFQATSWNLTTFADSALKRQRWNWMEAAITDTMRLRAAQGYERTIGFPGDGVYYPDLYIFAQNRYTDIRSFQSDSIGITSGAANQHIYSGVNNLRTSSFAAQPWPYVEATTGRTIWVHDLYTHPGDSTTVWSSMSSTFSNDIDGKMHGNQNALAKAILNDADFYWHPNYNLENSGIERPMQVIMRRWTYILGRLRRIVTVEPHYLNKTPRRTSIARG